MHARFDGMDKLFVKIDKRFDRVEAEIKAIPRAVAELIDERLRRGRPSGLPRPAGVSPLTLDPCDENDRLM